MNVLVGAVVATWPPLALLAWRQHRRIGFLGRRVRDQGDKASTMALEMHGLLAHNDELEHDVVALLEAKFDGSPS